MLNQKSIAAAGVAAALLTCAGTTASAATFGDPITDLDGFSYTVQNLVNGSDAFAPVTYTDDTDSNPTFTFGTTEIEYDITDDVLSFIVRNSGGLSFGGPGNSVGFEFGFGPGAGGIFSTISVLDDSDLDAGSVTPSLLGGRLLVNFSDDASFDTDTDTTITFDVSAQVVPLPAPVLLLLSALAGLGFLGHRRVV